MWSRLAQSFQSNDGYVYVIVALAVIGLVIFFERLISLQVRFNLKFSKFLLDVKKAMAAEDIDRAMNICKKAGNTSLPHIALKALEAADRDPTTIRSTIEEETIDFLPNLEARMTIIPSIATVVLLIGVLGTIDGLWAAFNSIDVLDTAQKQASLAHGIAGSLNATTLGLIVCLILLAGHQMLRGMALKITDKVHYGVTVLSNLLVPDQVAMPVAAAAPMGAAMGMPVADEAPVAADSGSSDFDLGGGEAAKDTLDDAFDDSAVDDIQDEEEII